MKTFFEETIEKDKEHIKTEVNRVLADKRINENNCCPIFYYVDIEARVDLYHEIKKIIRADEKNFLLLFEEIFKEEVEKRRRRIKELSYYMNDTLYLDFNKITFIFFENNFENNKITFSMENKKEIIISLENRTVEEIRSKFMEYQRCKQEFIKYRNL